MVVVTDIAPVVVADVPMSGAHASGLEIGELHLGGSGSSLVDSPMQTGSGDVAQSIQSTLAGATDAAESPATEVAGTVAAARVE